MFWGERPHPQALDCESGLAMISTNSTLGMRQHSSKTSDRFPVHPNIIETTIVRSKALTAKKRHNPCASHHILQHEHEFVTVLH
jgi:hypothetical protein